MLAVLRMIITNLRPIGRYIVNVVLVFTGLWSDLTRTESESGKLDKDKRDPQSIQSTVLLE